ncbi:MAG: NAD(+)/NADH kinase [Pseudomonadales bacterium]
MLKIGLLINPVAGIGGPTALKGSDGAAIQALAAQRGGLGRGEQRAMRALAAAREVLDEVRWLSWGGAMGERVLRELGIRSQVLGGGEGATDAADTRAAARRIIAEGADLLVFSGGDGTARDILDAVDQNVPVLGIPAGVKMHSGVFATTPENAGAILCRLVRGGLVRAGHAEVRDLDEDALRQGIVRPRFYGELAVPEMGGFLQHTKEGGRENELLALEEIVADTVDSLGATPGLYLLGPGSTLAAIKRSLGLDGTLIGFDAVYIAAGQGPAQVGSDLDAAGIERCLDRYGAGHVEVLLSFTRGQGFLIGRGNQQLTPALLRRIGRHRLRVVGTRSKLLSLEGRPLLLDSNDPELDQEWSGLVEVVTGYEDRLLYRLDSRA